MKYLALVLFLVACDTPSGSTCPTANAPTYDSFGKQFMETYCLDCHSSKAANRHDAPKNLNFDTEADVKAHLDDIDFEAASGPNATNTGMPERSPNVQMMPTKDERVLLGQFLACEKQ